MRSYTRQQLKQNAFAETTADTISWAVAHRSKVMAASIALAILVAVVAGGWAYVNYRDQQGRQELSSTMQKYGAPIRPAGTPATPDVLSFGSSQERAKVTNAEFARIADKYSFTESGALARYFEGLTYRDMGDNAAAEKQLKEVADGRHKEIASLAKLALGSLYEDTNQNSQALAIFKDLVDHPTTSVGKTTAQLELASLYEAMQQPGDAAKVYQEMQKDSPTGAAGQIATQKLQALKHP